MTSPKRKIWMQFSQGTKSNTEPFLKFAAQSIQNILNQNNSNGHGFLLGEGGGEFLILLYGICELHQTHSNSIKRKSLMEFRN